MHEHVPSFALPTCHGVFPAPLQDGTETVAWYELTAVVEHVGPHGSLVTSGHYTANVHGTPLGGGALGWFFMNDGEKRRVSLGGAAHRRAPPHLVTPPRSQVPESTVFAAVAYLLVYQRVDPSARAVAHDAALPSIHAQLLGGPAAAQPPDMLPAPSAPWASRQSPLGPTASIPRSTPAPGGAAAEQPLWGPSALQLLGPHWHAPRWDTPPTGTTLAMRQLLPKTKNAWEFVEGADDDRVDACSHCVHNEGSTCFCGSLMQAVMSPPLIRQALVAHSPMSCP